MPIAEITRSETGEPGRLLRVGECDVALGLTVPEFAGATENVAG